MSLYECDRPGCDWANPDWRYGFADAGATYHEHLATNHPNLSAVMALEAALCRVHHAQRWADGTVTAACAACVVATAAFLEIKALEA